MLRRTVGGCGLGRRSEDSSGNDRSVCGIIWHIYLYIGWRLTFGGVTFRRSGDRIYEGGIFEHVKEYSIPYIIYKHNLSITFIEVGGYI